MIAELRVAPPVWARTRFVFFRVAPRPFLLEITVHDARPPLAARLEPPKKQNGMRTIPYELQCKTRVSDSCPVWRSIILLKEEDQPDKHKI